jgi:excisionase family DNA binding protein
MAIRDNSEYLTVAETAELLKLGDSTIRRRIAAGELPAVRVARRGRGPVRVPRLELDEWLKQRRMNHKENP